MYAARMKLRLGLVAVAVVFGFGQVALAGPVGGPAPSFSLQLGSDVPGSALSLTPTLSANGDGTYSASGSSSVSGAYSILYDFVLNPDPSLSGSFTLTSLSTSTQTFSLSATMSGVSLAGPTRVGGSFGTVTYTDKNEGTLGLGANPFYRAEIDGGGIQDLGSFSFNPLTGGTGLSLIQSGEAFGVPIPNDFRQGGVSNSIGVRFAFTLTAGDETHLNDFKFIVVPEVTPIPLFAMSLALMLCRFARKRAFSR